MSTQDPQDRIDSLEDHIRDISRKTTADTVSDNSFYSYRHANRLFKSLKGESIHSYAKKIRMQASAEFLKYTDLSVLDIALEVGYESTAAFSKAFKKLYGQTPSTFREANEVSPGLISPVDSPYVIEFFEKMDIQVLKLEMTQESTVEEFIHFSQQTYKQLHSSADEWMVLWDEDPEMVQVADVRYFIGFPVLDEVMSGEDFTTRTVSGRYAIFTDDFLKQAAYEVWHELAFWVLKSEGKQLREGPYIEWFSETALASPQTYAPFKIAIPIE